MKRLFFILFIFFCFSDSMFASDTTTVQGHPKWIMQGNIYEVNVRQYTPEGTFKAFAEHLNRLHNMGVQTLWFMPIHPISKIDRKGSLGSYYAVADYTAVNPEFGTMSDWKNLVKECHAKGFKVIIDWVPNHTGADHYWLTTHPDFYVQDSTGKAVMAADWADTRKLNYNNRELCDTMIAQMKFWITETGIDGFRCDVAGDVPDKFWKKAIPELKKIKNIFMLAEGDKPALNADGFDATYTWNDFNMLKLIAKGQRKACDFDSAVNKTDATFPANALRMFFTSNHDENSWGAADYGTTPGITHAPFAVMTFTMKRSVPLIYSGQEEPVLRAIPFFEKDTIVFKNYRREAFYKTLLNLRKSNAALASNASYRKVNAGNEDAVYAYVRQSGNNKVLIILNWSNEKQTIRLSDKTLYGNVINVFEKKNEQLSSKSFLLKPWGYAVYVYQ
jgi:glycosidase